MITKCMSISLYLALFVCTVASVLWDYSSIRWMAFEECSFKAECPKKACIWNKDIGLFLSHLNHSSLHYRKCGFKHSPLTTAPPDDGLKFINSSELTGHTQGKKWWACDGLSLKIERVGLKSWHSVFYSSITQCLVVTRFGWSWPSVSTVSTWLKLK